jgi:hypothetical protein
MTYILGSAIGAATSHWLSAGFSNSACTPLGEHSKYVAKNKTVPTNKHLSEKQSAVCCCSWTNFRSGWQPRQQLSPRLLHMWPRSGHPPMPLLAWMFSKRRVDLFAPLYPPYHPHPLHTRTHTHTHTLFRMTIPGPDHPNVHPSFQRSFHGSCQEL